MTPEQAKALREPFKPEQIGKLPKPTKKDNPKGRCDFCGGWHGLPAVHLDYVGHAATTDRLLAVDPEWSWEPMAVGPNGEPLMTDGGLWIKLTVGGVTRPGFGDGNTPKEIIGDAIRNAAMRFGVALDLWAKEDLHATDVGDAPSRNDGKPKMVSNEQHGKIGALRGELKELRPEIDWEATSRKWISDNFGVGSHRDLTHAAASREIDWLTAERDKFKAELSGRMAKTEAELEAEKIPFG